jgi:hypothetical protein
MMVTSFLSAWLEKGDQVCPQCQGESRRGHLSRCSEAGNKNLMLALQIVVQSQCRLIYKTGKTRLNEDVFLEGSWYNGDAVGCDCSLMFATVIKVCTELYAFTELMTTASVV